ncbi:MAG: hypothetical protein FH762_05260 [Firmicutes bacterium]|nr:hypothetical protein [Bacillota bacterium]
MIRKQIYLDETMITQIRKIAVDKNISQSEVIRRSLFEYIKNEQLKGKIKDPLQELLGIVDLPLADGSENHDDYIYGGKNNA